MLSVSKDTLMKLWDLETKSCIQTIVGHRHEIWSLAVLSDPEDQSKTRIFTGSSDELIRGYKINDNLDEIKNSDDSSEILVSIGSVKRNSGNDRCSSLSLNASKTLLAAQSSGKVVEIFKIRASAEAKKKMKRRVKRSKLKQNSEEVIDSSEQYFDDTKDNLDVDEDETTNQSDLILQDELELITTIRSNVRVRSFTFNPISSNSTEDLALVSLVTNTLELHKIIQSSEDNSSSKVSIIDLQGHRSDIRGVAISHDGNTVATCSSESVKAWNARTLSCTSTCVADGYCLSICFVPGGRYVITGNKEGKLQIFDTASSECVFTNEEAHKDSAIWAIAVRPDQKGFMTGSADKFVKFWNFEISNSGLKAELERQLLMPSDVLSLRYNSNKSNQQLLVAVGLLDNSVRLFYDDSLKLFLTLYGHKLPVMCLDISYDNAILVSGSADKTIKIWGLDFGDCHRSLFAHEDSVTCIKFQPQTHYFFSSGKDGIIKYWDGDRFEQILFLTGHKGPIWGLEISADGSTVYSSGQDRTLRVWSRGEDLVFIEEEKEKQLEAQVDKSLEQDNIVNYNGAEIIPAAIKSVESLRGGELLSAAIDLIESELASGVQDKANPLLLGLTPHKYLLRTLRMIKSPDLEPALLMLPFHYVQRFIFHLIQMAKKGLDLELCCRCAVYLLLCHQKQICSTRSLLPELIELREIIVKGMGSYRELIGFNLAGLFFLQRKAEIEFDEKTALREPIIPKKPLTTESNFKASGKKRKGKQ